MSNPMNPDTGTLSLNRGTDNSRAEALESQLIDFPLASERLRKYDKKRFEKNARYNGLYQQHLALAESRDDHIRDIARDERIKNEPGIKWGEEDEKRLEYKRKQLARVRQRIRDLNAVRHPKAPKLTREESRCKEITDSLTPRYEEWRKQPSILAQWEQFVPAIPDTKPKQRAMLESVRDEKTKTVDAIIATRAAPIDVGGLTCRTKRMPSIKLSVATMTPLRVILQRQRRSMANQP
jgi:hypothetical protein